jgi:type IV secretion system protein VirD4
MATKSAPAPVNPLGSQILGWLIFVVGLALIALVVPKIAVSELRDAHFRSPFHVATTLPVIGEVYDPRSVAGTLTNYPPIAKEIASWHQFLPGVAVPQMLVPGAVPAFTHLLWYSGVALVVVFLAMLIIPPIVSRRRTSELHGSAGWNNWPTRFSSALRRSQYGVVLAQHHGKLLVHSGVENVLVLGPPGEGKTFGNAVPTLRVTWPWSAIVFDPTREIYVETAAERANFGTVFLFDPAGPKTQRFNPLAGIDAGDIDKIKQVLSPLFDSGSDKVDDAQYFLGRAAVIATAACAFVIENGHPELTSALAFIRNPQWKSADEPFKAMKSSGVRYVQEIGAEFAVMADKTRAPLIATFTDIFEVFASENVEYATSTSDFSARDFERGISSLYLVVREADAARLAPLMRLVLARLLDELMLEKPSVAQRPRILLLIDELPLLKAPFIQPKLGTMRKFGITAALLAQTLSQITRIYGPNQSVDGTCDVKVLYATEDDQTQKLGERLLGTTTQFDRGYDADGSPAASREQRRPLMFGHEFAMLRNRVVITKKGERPIKARKIQGYKDRRFARNNA